MTLASSKILWGKAAVTLIKIMGRKKLALSTLLPLHWVNVTSANIVEKGRRVNSDPDKINELKAHHPRANIDPYENYFCNPGGYN